MHLEYQAGSVMKRLVLILLMANALFFGWNRGWFELRSGPGDIGTGGPDPEFLRPVPLASLRAAAENSVDPSPDGAAIPDGSKPVSDGAGVQQEQPAPDRIRRFAPPAPRTPADASSGTGEAWEAAGGRGGHPANGVASPGPDVDLAATPGVSAVNGTNASDGETVTPAIGPGLTICQDFAVLEPVPAGELRGALEASGAQVQERRTEVGSSYLVYLPPAADEEQARQNLESARAIGRDDAFIIRDEPFLLGISLALFRHESAAQAMIRRLERAGERRAVLSARPPFQPRIALQALWMNDDDADAVAQLVRALGDRFGVAVQDCE